VSSGSAAATDPVRGRDALDQDSRVAAMDGDSNRVDEAVLHVEALIWFGAGGGIQSCYPSPPVLPFVLVFGSVQMNDLTVVSIPAH
jgi:hypothetical protein